MTARPLKVMFDASLAANPAGTGTFCRSLLEAAQRTPGLDIVVSAMGGRAISSVDIEKKSALQRAANLAAHLRYYAVKLPARAREARAVLIYSPAELGPLRGRTPAVITVHDLTVLRYPETAHWTSRSYLRAMLRVQVRRAAAVCSVSYAVAADLAAAFPRLSADRIGVVPDAPNPGLLQATPAPVPGVTGPFFLMVGTLEPRKNHVTAIRAFADYLQGHPERGEALLIAGSPGWLYRPVAELIQRPELADRVRQLGYVEAGQLNWLYRHARALLFPSLYEGFGIPVVEAFALGCPVVAADIPAIREVAGEGTATLLPPHDVGAWAGALEEVGRAQPDAIEAARRRAGEFTWEASAISLRDLLLSVAREKRPPSPTPAADPRPAGARPRRPTPPAPPPAAS